MALTKMKIQNVDTGKDIEVLFNPKEYTFTKSVPWGEHNIHGLDAPHQEFTSGNPMVLEVELFFDTYEKEGEERNVRKYTDWLETCTLVNPDKHRPPILLVTWGKALQFKCLLSALTQRFIMFLDDGTPCRAICNCTFKEYSPASEQLKAAPRHSPDHTKRRVVKLGDTLSWIAGKEYGDPAQWRTIAQANNIDNPMDLSPGTELLIPPLF